MRAALTKYSTSSSIKRFFRMFMELRPGIFGIFPRGRRFVMNRLNGYGKLYGERGMAYIRIFCWIGIIYLRNTRQMRSFYRSGRNVINGGDVGKPGWMRM